MMHIKLTKSGASFWISYIIVIIGCFFLPPMIEVGLALLFVFYVALQYREDIAHHRSRQITVILVFPVFLSIIQNIYLGAAVNHLNSFELQILLTLNIIIAVLIPVVDIIYTGKLKKNIWCFFFEVIIILFSVIQLAIYEIQFTAYLSSLRNILAPFVFFYFGAMLAKHIDIRFFERICFWLIWFVVLFGFVEYFIGNRLWQSLNITQLWNLKGIATPNEIPQNWFTSETYFGHGYIRRMVSSFADPVHLGAFLLWALITCWFFKKRFLSLLVLICCVLTVSKGALLGILIFGIVYMWYKDNSKLFFLFCFIIIAAIAIRFLKFGFSSSTGLHVIMFLRSLSMPFKHPFGTGVGSTGVLAGVVTNNQSSDGIIETGLGMVITQLGFIGVITYAVLFVMLFKVGRSINRKSKLKIYYYVLLYSIFANIIFNEVALSPNSCAIYFIVFGIFYSELSRDSCKTYQIKNE